MFFPCPVAYVPAEDLIEASLSDGEQVGAESERAKGILGEEALAGVEGRASQSPRGQVERHQLAAAFASVLGRSTLWLRPPWWIRRD